MFANLRQLVQPLFNPKHRNKKILEVKATTTHPDNPVLY